jgi:hypothetical protein
MGIEPREDPTAGIIEVCQQDTPWPTPFQPVMMRPIQLDQFADMRLPHAPRPMRPLAARKVIDPARPQPAPQRLVAERDPVVRGQLLHRQRGPKIAIPRLVESEDLRLAPLGDPSVRGAAPSPMDQPLIAFLLDPSPQASDLPIRHAQQCAGFLLRESVRQHLPNHMHPP